MLRLDPRVWWEVGWAYLYLLLAGWRLFVRREALLPWLQGVSRPRHALRPLATERVLRQARLIDLAARHPYPWARCLQRSLALCLWAARRGGRPVLRVGVQRRNGALDAHAWVEYGGLIVNDVGVVEQRFARLLLPSEPHRRERD